MTCYRSNGCWLLLSLALAGLLMLWSPVMANTVKWTTVGRWDISYYPGAKGCQAFSVFEGDTAFFIGFDTRGNNRWLDVTLLDPHWSKMQSGEVYEIIVRFDDESPWMVSMAGLVIDDFPGLNILIDADSDQAIKFIEEFRRKHSMEWTFDGDKLGRYALTGSFDAFGQVEACQKSYEVSTQTQNATAPTASN